MYRFVTSSNTGYVRGQGFISLPHMDSNEDGADAETDREEDFEPNAPGADTHPRNTPAKRKRPKRIHTYQAWGIFPVYALSAR